MSYKKNIEATLVITAVSLFLLFCILFLSYKFLYVNKLFIIKNKKKMLFGSELMAILTLGDLMFLAVKIFRPNYKKF